MLNDLALYDSSVAQFGSVKADIDDNALVLLLTVYSLLKIAHDTPRTK